MAATGLTDIERAAVQILLDRTLANTVVELNNMAERLPAVKALPEALNKMLAKLNDSAAKVAVEMEQAGDEGQATIGAFSAVAKEVKSTFEEVKSALDVPATNAGPLSQG